MTTKRRYGGSEPLDDPQHEAFVQALFGQGLKRNLTQAYIAAYPGTKRTSAATLGDRLFRKVEINARLKALMRKSADALVLTRAKYLKLLERRVLKGFDGFRNVLTILPDGTKTIEINEDNADIVKKGTSRVDTSGQGDGRQDAAFTTVEVIDPLPYGQELAALMDWYPAKKLAVSGDGKGKPIPVVIMDERRRKLA